MIEMFKNFAGRVVRTGEMRRFLRLPELFILLLGCVLVAGCSSFVRDPIVYDDGLMRSTPGEQGVPSGIIARFFEQVESKLQAQKWIKKALLKLSLITTCRQEV